MLLSYMDQLAAVANRKGVKLLDAFLAAGVADSTFYRCKAGRNELRLQTAQKVLQHIDHLAAADARQDGARAV